MMRRVNTGGAARPVLPGPLLWVVLFGLMLAWPASGQDAAEPAQAPKLEWADGEMAFELVQRWVRSEDGVPDEADLPRTPVTGLFGVYVTLRDAGRVLGLGQALRADVVATIDQSGPPVSMADLLAAATRQALDEVRDTEMKRAVELRINDPELFQQGLMATRRRLQVDVQLGYKLESIVLPPDADDAAVFTQFAPGFHGLRMSGPLASRADYAWPATALSRNTTASRLMHQLLNQQGFNANDLPLVARADGPALQRFEVYHMVRPAPAQPMRQLIRGNLIVPQQIVDGRTIGGLAERAARHLDALIVRNDPNAPLTVLGTFQPSSGRYSPEFADAREVALLCYALSRYASVSIQAGVAGEVMLARAGRVVEAVVQYAKAALPEGRPVQHLTAAFFLMALDASPVDLDADAVALRDKLSATLAGLRHPDGGFAVARGEDRRLSRASAAVVTAALAADFARSGDAGLGAVVWAALGELMQVNAEQPLVVDLVWTALAIDQAGPGLAAAQKDPAAANETLNQWRAALADFLDQLSDQQVRGRPLLGPQDVTGGFVLNPPPPGSPPNPNWQSAMPLIIMAAGLRDPGIVPPDRNFGPLLSAGLAARFLGQLMITETNGYYLRNPKPALGGVRSALWDNTLYPDCSSMALIALAELQHTLKVLEPKEDKQP